MLARRLVLLLGLLVLFSGFASADYGPAVCNAGNTIYYHGDCPGPLNNLHDICIKLDGPLVHTSATASCFSTENSYNLLLDCQNSANIINGISADYNEAQWVNSFSFNNSHHITLKNCVFDGGKNFFDQFETKITTQVNYVWVVNVENSHHIEIKDNTIQNFVLHPRTQPNDVIHQMTAGIRVLNSKQVLVQHNTLQGLKTGAKLSGIEVLTSSSYYSEDVNVIDNTLRQMFAVTRVWGIYVTTSQSNQYNHNVDILKNKIYTFRMQG
ncbi:MAG: hypothetical protein V1834_04100, partial [Candidatus Micrarchaeota archaeon]